MSGPDWNAIADACLKVWKGGGWQLAGFICFIVLIRWWPWRKTGKGE